jgi:uncharacterized protein involved in exopolysaccharide biosynthesis
MRLPETVLRRESPEVGATPSMASLVIPLVRKWKRLLGVPLAIGALTAVVSAVVPSTYTATTTFTAEVTSGSALPANLSDIASRFSLPGGRTGTSQPDYFAEVLTSQEILISTLGTSFADDRYSPPRQRYLLDIFHIKGETAIEQLETGVRRLRRAIHVSFSTRTDMVTLSVDAPTAVLAADGAAPG